MSSRPQVQLAWLSLAMFLGMTLWFSATAVTGPIAAEVQLDETQTAWLTMAVQAGFVAGTLLSALLNLPDVINARRLFALGCAIGALANACLAVARAPVAFIALRVVTGVALAWVYPPGMKIAAGWFKDRRGTALGILIGALTIGSAFPHLMAAFSARAPWRSLVLAASSLATAGGVVVLLRVGDGPYVSARAPFDPSAVSRVFSDRATRLATLGYLGHMWELYAVWTWMAAFVSAGLYGVGFGQAPPSSTTGSALAFTLIASGAIGSAVAGHFGDRLGKARVAASAMLVSGACSVLAGTLFGAPPLLVGLFALVWGIAVVADSAQLSALVAEYSPRHHVGTALTVQTCCGFLLTMASIRFVPLVARAIGWQWAFLSVAPGPFLGALALRGMVAFENGRLPPRPSVGLEG